MNQSVPVFDLRSLKQDFFSRFPDPTFFSVSDFNLIKVVMEALKVDYANRGIRKNRFFFPEIAHDARRIVRKLYEKPQIDIAKLGELSLRKYVFVDHSGRTVNSNGEPVSLYFKEVKQKVDGIAHITEITHQKHDFDLLISDLRSYVRANRPDRDTRLLKQELRRVYKIWCESGAFSEKELLNIRVSLEKFLNDYRVWSFLIGFLPQEKIYLLCHYHKEGAILAMKRAGKRVIELQHGLISANDLFYVLPENIQSVRERALFADKILVYGQYWKHKLMQGFEYPEDKIGICGYYHSSANVLTQKEDSKFILITTQTYLHDNFIQYIKALSEKLLAESKDVLICVKTHPSEKSELYLDLKDLANVTFSSKPLPELFPFSLCQVSIYSTALYEGYRAGVKGFSIDVETCRGYIDELVADGVSERIKIGESPLDRLLTLDNRDVSKMFASLSVAEILNA